MEAIKISVTVISSHRLYSIADEMIDNESDGGDSVEGFDEAIGPVDRKQSKDNVTTLNSSFSYALRIAGT